MTNPKRAHFSAAFTEKTTSSESISENAASKTENEQGSPRSHQKSRTHKIQIPFYSTPETRKQLKMLCVEMGRTQEDLLREALNDLFKKHGKPSVA